MTLFWLSVPLCWNPSSDDDTFSSLQYKNLSATQIKVSFKLPCPISACGKNGDLWAGTITWAQCIDVSARNYKKRKLFEVFTLGNLLTKLPTTSQVPRRTKTSSTSRYRPKSYTGNDSFAQNVHDYLIIIITQLLHINTFYFLNTITVLSLPHYLMFSGVRYPCTISIRSGRHSLIR